MVREDLLALFTNSREGLFPETMPTYLCSDLHEYSARVTSGSKPQVIEVAISPAQRAKRLRGEAAGGYGSSLAPQSPLFLCSEMNFRQITFSETQRS
jgi:hypothetical protein